MDHERALLSPIASRADFHKAIVAAFERAAQQGCREIFICDTDFADWPLGERAVVTALTQWAYKHRRLTVLASSFDEILRRHPRWVEWRRNWGHVVECRSIDDVEAEKVPRLWFAPGLQAVRLVDPLHYRGFIDEAQADLISIREQIDEIANRSTPAFPVTLLGL